MATQMSEPEGQAHDRATVAMRWAWRLVIAVGVLLRVQRYADNRSFWLDESLLGLNLIEKSARGLLGALDYVQSAPQGFLLMESSSIAALGESERVFRLIPFVASVASLVLFAAIVRRLLLPSAALLATTLFAVNEPLLFQSSEAKPYSSDVLFAVLIVWVTLRLLDRPEREPEWRSIMPLTIIGAVAVWFSFPAAFVLVGAYGALLLRVRRHRWRQAAAVLVPVGAIWSASFIVLYAVSSGTIATVRRSVFAGDVHTGTRLSNLARVGWVSLEDPLGFYPSLRGIAMLCLVVGLVIVATTWRRDRFVLLVLPASLAIAAAVVDKYPAGGRFWLFLVPFALVLICRAVQELFAPSRRGVLFGIPLVLLLLVPMVGQSMRHVAHPPRREHVRPLLQELVKKWQPGDRLYVYRNAQYALRFYGECDDCGVPRYPFPLKPAPPGADDGAGNQAALASTAPAVTIGKAHRSQADTLAALDSLSGRRVWLLFSHVSGSVGGFDEEDVFLAYLGRRGRLLFARREPEAALYLYDLGDHPASSR